MIRLLLAALAPALLSPSVARAAVVPSPQDDVAKAERLAVLMTRTRYVEKREEVWSDLVEMARADEAVRPALANGLAELWNGANRRLDRRSVRRSFSKLVEARQQLDRLRAETLAIVRDETAYPYPYQPPAATAEQVKAYTASQRRIDKNVEAMRALWDDGPSAKLSRDVRAGAERAHWSRRKAKWVARELGLAVTLEPTGADPWMYGLPFEHEAEVVDLSTFAVTLEEADALARDRAVEARNSGLLDELTAKVDEEDEVAVNRLRRERDHVQRTNDYRRMLGVRALGWNEELYWAVRNHVEYLAQTGVIGHEQPEPALATFQKRAKWFGYEGLVWENCHSGSTSGRGALGAWIRSSEHHRTILNASLTEMATGNDGTLWVQKFGLDTEFESEIQCHPWRD